MGVIPDCSYSVEMSDEFNYRYLRYEHYYCFDMVPKWTSKVRRSLKLSQKILGLLTFGISLFCRWISEDHETYSVFSGTIGYTDALSIKTCKLLEKKMSKEKIIFKSYIFSIYSGVTDYEKSKRFSFKSIDNDVFVKCFVGNYHKKEYRYGKVLKYHSPTIRYEVEF